jgi:CRP/FNR family nitrogen fixation transcriptional regulator
MQIHTAASQAHRVPAAVAFGLPSRPAYGRPQTRPADGAPAADLQRVLAKGEELYVEGEAADCFFKVISGALRTSKLLGDGRRQIDAFHLPGDIFGLEAGAARRFSAEAMGDAVVIGFHRSRLDTRGGADPVLREQVLRATLVSLERAQEHLMLLGRKSASEKLASFLLEMSQRLGSASFDLPMSRADIADHLGLTIETVSRTLTRFAREGLIGLKGLSRHVELRDRAALRQLDA